MRRWFWFVFCIFWGSACGLSVAAEGSSVHPSPEAVASLRKMAVHPDFRAQVYASEPLVINPVGFAFDDRGRCFVVETHRRQTSVFDIRQFQDWLDDDFSFRTVADRRAFLKRYVVPDNPSIAEQFREDRNKDGIFDAGDLAVESEKIRLLEDRDGDGATDAATLFAGGFNTVVSGAASGVLPFGDSVWFACIPDFWLLRDRNGNGAADEREALHSGFGGHIGLSGHDLHGAAMGPDGRLYFSMGDRGAHIEKEGKVLAALPDTGAVFRCEPDGSRLEVVAVGLRNPQGLAFDDYGNLWTVDNGTNQGDQARLIHIVEDGDFGWHIGWQWLPDLGPWNAEKLWQAGAENTGAYLLPPAGHVGNRPAGLSYYPGTGLPERFRGRFFLADFAGGVRVFTVSPQGASFAVPHSREELQDTNADNMAGKLIWGLSPVDVGFAPKSGLYVADWAGGEAKSGKGRILRLFNELAATSPEAAETERILSTDFKDFSVQKLVDLLEHDDRRLRLKAQSELAGRYQPAQTAVGETLTDVLGWNPLSALRRVAQKSNHQLARLHALWGLGQILAKHRAAGHLLPFLNDRDPEVRAQTAKTLAGRGVVGFHSAYLSLLKDPDPRVRFYGALWWGKTVLRGYHEVQASDTDNQLISLRDTGPIFDLLRENADADPYLRHAGVMALTWIHDLPSLMQARSDAARAARLGAVLALRRLERPEIAIYLEDSDPQIVLEAARAIHDRNIKEALPQLADLSRRPALLAPVLRRSLNALLRLGKTENAAFLVAFAANPQAPEPLRVEALEALGAWANPPKRDRVIGLWRPAAERDKRSAIVPLRLALPDLLGDPSNRIQEAALKAILALRMTTEGERLKSLTLNPAAEENVRLAAWQAIAQTGGPDFWETLRALRHNAPEKLATLAQQAQTQLPVEAQLQLYRLDLEEDSTPLRRAALQGLSELSDPRAGRLLELWLDRLLSGDVPKALVLDILEATKTSPHKTLAAKVKAAEQQHPANRLTQYRGTLHGGDAEKGRQLFKEGQGLACARCHQTDQGGGNLGPDLSGIGRRLSREKLLESIVHPDDEITPGFESVQVKLHNCLSHTGIVQEETETELTLASLEEGRIKVAKADIASRSRKPSPMRDLAAQLSKRELRDLIAFLASLK